MAINLLGNVQMIKGYKFIYRASPKHEPQIIGSRLTVTWVAHELNSGDTIDGILERWSSSGVTREMIEEAKKYYFENKCEIDSYMAESRAGSGSVLKPNE